MFRLSVMQNQWLMLALLGGLALIGLVTLMYLALWRPRASAQEAETISRARARTWVKFFPWVLVFLFVAGAVWAVLYVLRMIQIVPNW